MVWISYLQWNPSQPLDERAHCRMRDILQFLQASVEETHEAITLYVCPLYSIEFGYSKMYVIVLGGKVPQLPSASWSRRSEPGPSQEWGLPSSTNAGIGSTTMFLVIRDHV